MRRVALVTGAASGIGKATAELLDRRGYQVVRADLQGADVDADLSTTEGRQALVDGVNSLTRGRLDAVLAVAGVSKPKAIAVAVNYFGTLATLMHLRSMLLTSNAPRAVTVSSAASLLRVDGVLVSALENGDEDGALRRARELEGNPDAQLIYPSTKKALARWIRREAPRDDWAGRGIALNAVAPGVVDTPMIERFIEDDDNRQRLLELVPMPLNGIAPPEAVAHLLSWLVSEENTHLCGQVIFVDGGTDAVLRGDTDWS